MKRLRYYIIVEEKIIALEKVLRHYIIWTIREGTANK